MRTHTINTQAPMKTEKQGWKQVTSGTGHADAVMAGDDLIYTPSRKHAKLIAAAPEILEALKLAKDCLELERRLGRLPDSRLSTIAALREVISKATE